MKIYKVLLVLFAPAIVLAATIAGALCAAGGMARILLAELTEE